MLARTTQQQAQLEQHCGTSLTSRSLSLSSSSAAARCRLLPPAVHSWSESSASEPAAAFLLRLPAAAGTQAPQPCTLWHAALHANMPCCGCSQHLPPCTQQHVHSLAHLQTWVSCWSSGPAQCDTAMRLGWRPTRCGRSAHVSHAAMQGAGLLTAQVSSRNTPWLLRQPPPPPRPASCSPPCLSAPVPPKPSASWSSALQANSSRACAS